MPKAYRLENISYQYGPKTALSLKALFINAHQKTALIGANGSGKSTLLNLLAFLTCPHTGKLEYFDKQVPRKQLLSLRKQVGMLPQKPYMLRGSVEENLQLSLKLHGIGKTVWRNRINQTLSQLQIGHLIHQQASCLSGGELQKAALARILVFKPKVLLLDEPFSYLDQQSSLLLEQFISDYGQTAGHTLIFSTHNRLQGMALAENIISLVNGRAVKTPLINLYHGHISKHCFHTDKLQIMLTEDIITGQHISIDPSEIVISKQALHSSMRNNYSGRIIAIVEEKGHIRLAIDAGEIFQSLITYQAFRELNLHLGDTAWVNFKANALVVF